LRNEEWFNQKQDEILANKVEDGPVKLAGSQSYVEPKSWIRNSKLRDIVLFGSKYDEELYN
jgi:hypothetical protein